jgi:hypothetical protein
MNDWIWNCMNRLWFGIKLNPGGFDNWNFWISLYLQTKVKGKAIPVTGHEGP